MAHQYNLWLEYAGDWHTLRTFMFDACSCTGFVAASMTPQVGRPDAHEPVSNVHNAYNLINFHRKFVGRAYKNDVQVSFTLNNPDRWLDWQRDVISASVRWVARNTGDALLDWDGLAILGRKDSGSIVVNDFSKNRPTSRVEDARRPEYRVLVEEMLRREGLARVFGPLDPI